MHTVCPIDEVARFGREGQVGARSEGEIGMSVVRGGDVVGVPVREQDGVVPDYISRPTHVIRFQRPDGSNPALSATHPSLCQQSRYFPVIFRLSGALRCSICVGDTCDPVDQGRIPRPSLPPASRASVKPNFPANRELTGKFC